MNLNTNPPSIDIIDFDNHHSANFSLSDDNGKLILYGGTCMSYNAKKRTRNYVIRNNKNKTLVSFTTSHVINAYYAAIISSVWPTIHGYTMRLYRFDNNGILKDSLISQDLNYSCFAFFIPQTNGDISFLAYDHRNKIIKNYKLSGNKMFQENISKTELPKFYYETGMDDTVYYILTTKDGNKIICLLGDTMFLLDFKINTGEITVIKEYNNTFNSVINSIALSANNKYLIVSEKEKIIRYKLSDEFEFSNGEIIYESTDNCTDMQLYDGKIYALFGRKKDNPSDQKIIYFDGIETDNITVGNIDCTNLSNFISHFPKIPRIIETKSTPCPEIEKPKIICE